MSLLVPEMSRKLSHQRLGLGTRREVLASWPLTCVVARGATESGSEPEPAMELGLLAGSGP